MQIAALIRRALSRPAWFVLRRAADSVRHRAWSVLARWGANPYRIQRKYRLGGGGQDRIWARRLRQWDRSLILPPEEARDIARALPAAPPAAEDPPFGSELLTGHKVSFFGQAPVDLTRPDWNLDSHTGLSWPPAWHAGIDYMDLARPSDVKVPWELGRMQYLATLGRAYLRTGDETFARRFADLVRHWDTSNPCGWNVTWAVAMNVCFRATSLLWARTFFAGSPSLDAAFWRRMAQILVEHGRYVWRNLEYSDINANHYTSNIVCLLQLGLAVPWYPESRRWRRFAAGELEREILAQTYDDGVGYEGSTFYHRLVLELFLHAALSCRRNGVELSAAYWGRLERMFEFAAAYLKPDGTGPLFGDNDDAKVQFLGDQPSADHRYLAAVGAVLFGRADLKAAAGAWWEEAFWLTGLAGKRTFDRLPPVPAPSGGSFPGGGFWFLRAGGTYAAIDCGDAGLRGRGFHGHNDTLSVEVCLAGRSVIVDKGCHSYTSDTDRRVACLSGRGHNAPVLDGAEPHEILFWKIPTIGPTPHKPLSWRITDAGGEFRGEHRGYLRSHGVVCRRTVRVDRPGEVVIEDELLGQGEHDVLWRWLFAPGLTLTTQKGSGVVSADRPPARDEAPASAETTPAPFSCFARDEGGRVFSLCWEGAALAAATVAEEYHPGYGRCVSVACLELAGRATLPMTVRFRLRHCAAPPSAG